MKKQNGITLVTLTITIVVIMIIASISVNYGVDLIKQAKLQDLRTNMLLIQAETKKGLEEVSFQTANLDKNKAEDVIKIDSIKAENLKGHKISENPSIEEKLRKIGCFEESNKDNYYYFETQDLENIGLKEVSTEEYGYFVVKYDIENVKVEVINTEGYKGNYTLEEINTLVEEQ